MDIFTCLTLLQTILGYYHSVNGQTVGGNSGGRPCVFPFQYKNVQYISCILTDHHRKWCSTTANYDKDKTWGECESEDLANMPGFDLSTPKNITVTRGDTARLPCVVNKLGNKQITWTKKGQQFPLAAAQYSFLGTDKYIVEREARGHRQWNLLVKDVQREDRGVYVCRVTTRTMLLAREIYLNIKGEPLEMTTAREVNYDTGNDPQRQQEGQLDVNIVLGSQIFLQCNSTSQSEVYGDRVIQHNFIQWFKDERKIDSNIRNGIMITNLVNGGLAQSNLTIEKARTEHNGIYYCTSTNKTKAKFRVKVSEKDTRLIRDEPNSGRSSDREEEVTQDQRGTRLPESLLNNGKNTAASLRFTSQLLTVMVIIHTLINSILQLVTT